MTGSLSRIPGCRSTNTRTGFQSRESGQMRDEIMDSVKCMGTYLVNPQEDIGRQSNHLHSAKKLVKGYL